MFFLIDKPSFLLKKCLHIKQTIFKRNGCQLGKFSSTSRLIYLNALNNSILWFGTNLVNIVFYSNPLEFLEKKHFNPTLETGSVRFIVRTWSAQAKTSHSCFSAAKCHQRRIQKATVAMNSFLCSLY